VNENAGIFLVWGFGFWVLALGQLVAGRVGRSGDWPIRRDEVERAGKVGDALAGKQAVALGDSRLPCGK
jgi:hypothetical protein